MKCRRIAELFGLFLVSTLATGCGLWLRATDPAGTRTFRGRYGSGFEASGFLECGSKPNSRYWWAEFAPDATHRVLDSARASLPREGVEASVELYLEVKATLSRRGKFGHLGAAPRQLTILTITQAAPWSDDACEGAAQVGERL